MWGSQVQILPLRPIFLRSSAKHADLIAAPADTLNFIGFSVVIDGRALTPKVDARALLAGRETLRTSPASERLP